MIALKLSIDVTGDLLLKSINEVDAGAVFIEDQTVRISGAGDSSGRMVRFDDPSGNLLSYIRASDGAFFGPLAPSPKFALLNTTLFSDVTADSVARGALITGQGASPTWAKLALGTSGYFLKSDGTDAAWANLFGASNIWTAAQIISNNIALQWKDTGGTARSIIKLDSNDDLRIARGSATKVISLDAFDGTSLVQFTNDGSQVFQNAAATLTLGNNTGFLKFNNSAGTATRALFVNSSDDLRLTMVSAGGISFTNNSDTTLIAINSSGDLTLSASGAHFVMPGNGTYQFTPNAGGTAITAFQKDSSDQLLLGIGMVSVIFRIGSTSIGKYTGTGFAFGRNVNPTDIVEVHTGSAKLLGFTTTAQTFVDAYNVVFGTSTGTKIGTGTTQKLAFHNSTPVIQRSGAAQAAVATTGSTTLAFGYTTAAQADAIVTLLNEIRATLVEKGLMTGA